MSTSRNDEARRAIEAVLMAATEPIEAGFLAQLTELPAKTIEALCQELAEEYEQEGRGFVLIKVAGGYRFQTAPDMSAYVEKFVIEGQRTKLSVPALETLAIVAYKQPISRTQISSIRGVNVDSVVTTLLEREYIAETGTAPGPGAPALLGTTTLFLERMGMNSLDELPPLSSFVPNASLVEALEHGLRIEDSPAEVMAEDSGTETA